MEITSGRNCGFFLNWAPKNIPDRQPCVVFEIKKSTKSLHPTVQCTLYTVQSVELREYSELGFFNVFPHVHKMWHFWTHKKGVVGDLVTSEKLKFWNLGYTHRIKDYRMEKPLKGRL